MATSDRFEENARNRNAFPPADRTPARLSPQPGGAPADGGAAAPAAAARRARAAR